MTNMMDKNEKIYKIETFYRGDASYDRSVILIGPDGTNLSILLKEYKKTLPTSVVFASEFAEYLVDTYGFRYLRETEYESITIMRL